MAWQTRLVVAEDPDGVSEAEDGAMAQDSPCTPMAAPWLLGRWAGLHDHWLCRRGGRRRVQERTQEHCPRASPWLQLQRSMVKAAHPAASRQTGPEALCGPHSGLCSPTPLEAGRGGPCTAGPGLPQTYSVSTGCPAHSHLLPGRPWRASWHFLGARLSCPDQTQKPPRLLCLGCLAVGTTPSGRG